MPRLPVDGKKVVEHRITFGTKEREILDSALGAYQFNRVASPVVAGLSDVSFVITLGALLTYFFPDIVIPKGVESADEVWDAIITGIDAGEERARQERAESGEATLDDATGIRDFLGRLRYNLTNPNWGIGGPGFRDAWREAFD